jgi:hypothetical protein
VLNGEDGRNARKGVAKGLVQGHPQCGRLGGAVGAGALKGHAHGAIGFNIDEFHVATVGDEAGAQAVEDGLDFLFGDGAGVDLHRLLIGGNALCVEGKPDGR